MAKLTEIRHAGYCVSRGEPDVDILGIAAPVRGASGTMEAVLSVAALEHRIPDRRLDEVVAAVRDAAEHIGSRPAMGGD